MTNRSIPARHRVPPISWHPAFPALICLWLAALWGLAVWVVPLENLRAAMVGTFLAPLARQPQALLAAMATLSGAAAGTLVAKMVRLLSRGRPLPPHERPGKAPAHRSTASQPAIASPCTAKVMPQDELPQQPGPAGHAMRLDSAVTPPTETRHGAAVAKLRRAAPRDLSLIELVERFAVALEDYRFAAAHAPRPGFDPIDTASPKSRHPRTDSGEIALRDALKQLEQMAGAA